MEAVAIRFTVSANIKTRLKRNAGGTVRSLPMLRPLPVFDIGIGTNVVQSFGAFPAFLFRPLHANLLSMNMLHIRVSAIYRACKAHLPPGGRNTPKRTASKPYGCGGGCGCEHSVNRLLKIKKSNSHGIGFHIFADVCGMRRRFM